MMPLTKKPQLSSELLNLIQENTTTEKAPVLYESNMHTGQTDYSKYDINSYASDDMQDSRAMQQTNWEAWGNILATNTGKAAARTIDGALFIPAAVTSLLYGTATGEVDGVASAVTAVFDNPVSKLMRQSEEWLDKQMPVYQTKRQEASYSPFNLGFANSMMDGLAYVASMYTGAGLIGAGKNLARGGIKLAMEKLGSRNVGAVIANAIENGDDLNYVGSLFSDGAKLVGKLKEVDGIKKAGNVMRNNFYDVWGGLVESGAEAAETRKSVEDNLTAQMLQENAGQPLSEEQKKTVKDRAEEAGSLNFAANMFTTTLANKMVFGKMFKNKWSDDMVAHNNLVKDATGKYAMKEIKGKTAQYLDNFKKSPILTGVLTEGGQEGTQFASNDFFVNVFSNPSINSVQSLSDIGTILGTAIEQTTGKLGSKDAVHSMLIGGLIGGPMNGYLGRNENAEQQTKAQDYANKANLAPTEQVIKSMAKNIDLSNAMDGAVIAGDQVTFETLKNNQVFDWVYNRHQMGKFGDIKQELDEARALPLDTFKSKYEIDNADYSEENRTKYIDYMERVAQNTKNSYTSILSNYGHKIAALSQEAPDMLKYLTMVDVHAKDYIARENQLLVKLSPYMKPADLEKLVMPAGKVTELETSIKELDTKFKTISDQAVSDPESAQAKMKQLTDITNEINGLQNLIATSVTEANYKDMMNLGTLEEPAVKKSTDKTQYQEYAKDLADLKNIQKAKEETINYYNKIVNNTDYAKKVQQQINAVNQSKVLKDVFRLNLNQNVTETTNTKGELEREFGFTDSGKDRGDVEDFVKPGDIYSLNRQYESYDYDPATKKRTKKFERYLSAEVVGTRIEMQGATPHGIVELRSADGKRMEMTMPEFKASVRPIQGGNEFKDYKYRLAPEDSRFFKLYRNNAIKYQIKDGAVVTGMLGFSPYSPGLVLNYFEDNGTRHTVPFTPTEYRNNRGGYIEILSEDATLVYKLKDGINVYIKDLAQQIKSKTKAISTTQARIQKMNTKLNDMNSAKIETVNAVKSLITQSERFAEKLEDEIAVMTAASERLNKLKAIPLVENEALPEEYNIVINDINNYYNAAKRISLEATGSTPKQIKNEKVTQAMQITIDGNTQKIGDARRYAKQVKQALIDNVRQTLAGDTSKGAVEHLTQLNDAVTNPHLDDQYIAALAAIDDLGLTGVSSINVPDLLDTINNASVVAREELKNIETEYRDKILSAITSSESPTELAAKYEEYRNAEHAAIMKLASYVNNSGYWLAPKIDYTRKTKETVYDLTHEDTGVTQRPEFVIKSTTGAGTNPFKKAFQDNIPFLDPNDLVMRVIPSSEYSQYQLKANGETENGVVIKDPIYLEALTKSGTIPRGTMAMITSMPLPTLQDSFGPRFRDAENIPKASTINDLFDAVFEVGNNADYLDRLDEAAKKVETSADFGQDDKAYARLAAAHLKDLFEFRNTAKEGKANLNITGKSNGVAVIDPNNNTTKYITETGKVLVADGRSMYVGGREYATTAGRAYFHDENAQLFFPVVVDQLGDKTFTYGTKNSKKKFVDNIIDGAKYVRAAMQDKAIYTTPNKEKKTKSLTDALTEYNNMLSNYVYQNREADDLSKRFTYDRKGNDIVFFIGVDEFSLNNDEDKIREKLKFKLLNIDRKGVDEQRVINIYSVSNPSDVNSEASVFYSKVEYNDFVKNNFGVKTNIDSFSSGYVTFDGSVSSPVTVQPPAETSSTPSIPRASRRAARGGEGAVSMPVPRVAGTVAGQPLSAANRRGNRNPNPAVTPPPVTPTNTAITPPPASSPDLPPQRVRRPRTPMLAATYQGDISNVMSFEDYDRARKKFVGKYGVEFEVVKGLVDNDAFGEVTAAAETLLSDRAPRGTDYHEEFHLVSQHILPASDTQAMYDDYRTQNSVPDMSNEVAEERLAELYRMQSLGYEGITGVIREIFDKLTRLIRKLLSIKANIQDINLDIYEGKYYGKPVYAGTTAYKMKAIPGDERTELEKIPAHEKIRANRAMVSRFVTLMRWDLSATIPLYDAEVSLLEKENPTEAEQADIQYYAEQRQLEALSALLTNPQSRRGLLNTDAVDGNEGIKFDEFVEQSVDWYIQNANDTIAAKYRAATDQSQSYGDDNFFDAVDELKDTLRRELNLDIPEDAEVDEYSTSKSPVKVGDTEVDFFQETTTQLKLLAYTQMENNGVYPINVATLSKIYFDNLTNAKTDDEFFNRLISLSSNPAVSNSFGTQYANAVRGINEIIGLSNPNPTLNETLLQQMLYGMFNKREANYKVLKIVDSETGPGFNRYWVDQANEKRTGEVRKEFNSYLQMNYDRIKAMPLFRKYREALRDYKTDTKNKDYGKILDAVGSEARAAALFELTGMYPQDVSKVDYPNLDTILNHFISFPNDYLSYINNNKGNVKTFIDIRSSNNIEKIFSIRNAEGNPLYSLQNPSSIHYALDKYHNEINATTASKLMLNDFVYLNGTQYSAVNLNNFKDTRYSSADNLIASDLQVMYYMAVTDPNNPTVPYIFNGDKSTIGGFTLSGTILDKGNLGQMVRAERINEIFRKEIYELDSLFRLDQSSSKVKVANKELPFFTFMKSADESKPGIYESIIAEIKEAAKEPDSRIALDEIYNSYEDFIQDAAYKHFESKANELFNNFADIGFFNENNGMITPEETRYFAEVFALGVYEQTQLTGSLAFYSDPAKRLYAWTSAKRSINTRSQFLKMYNQRYGSNMGANFRSLVVDDVKNFTDWKGNNPADAQAWVTLDTARFMLLGSGTFNPQLEEEFNAIEELDNKSNITEADIAELNEYTKQIGEQVNVLKPQSFANQSLNGLEVPTFYKFSVLPLTKALTAGKNVERMLDFMKANDINILMVDSANKVGRKIGQDSRKLYDADGNFVLDQQGLPEDYIQSTPWKGIGLQLDMSNVHNTTTVGTQSRKLITENLKYLPDATYIINGESYTADGVNDLHETLTKQKITNDLNRLQQELGVSTDFSVIDIKATKKKLYRMVSRSANATTALLQDIQNLGSYDLSTNKAKLQGVINGVLAKGVIRQKTTGDAKAMVSSVGFERKGDNIKTDKALKFYKDEDGQRFMEVYLPYSFKEQYKDFVVFDPVDKIYKFKERKDMRAVDKVRSIIGYRIPTQSQGSIENICIKGFMPEAHGNAVVVPFEITSKAGSDFDIDKLIMYLPKFSKGKYLEDDVDNQLLNLYTELMSDPTYYKLFVKSIDGKVIESIAKQIEIDNGTSGDKQDNTFYHNFFDPVYLAKRRDSFISAKKTLGAAALATTHHAESQKHGLAWKEQTQVGNMMITNTIGQYSMGDLLGMFVPGIVNNGLIRFDRVYVLEENGENSSRFISDVLSEYVNAFVDAAKDDYITSANVDMKTISVAMLLTRAGIPENLVLNFLAQPGVVNYTRALKESKTNTRRTSTKNDVDEKFKGGIATRAVIVEREMRKTLADQDLNSQAQLDYIALYQALTEYGQLMTSLQQATSFDTKATGKMIEQNELNLMKYNAFMKNEFNYWHNVGNMTNADTSFQATMRTVAEKGDRFNAEFFNVQYLYNKTLGNGFDPNLADEVSAIQNLRESVDDIAERENKLKNYYVTHLVQKRAAAMLPGGEAELAGSVQTAINSLMGYKGNNAFVKGLKVIDKRIYAYGGAALSSEELSLRQAAYTELQYEDPELARDLLYAGIASHGMVINPHTYMNQISGTEIVKELGIVNVDQPLLEIYTKLNDKEKKVAVRSAKSHADKAYSDIVSNYTLKPVNLAPSILNEPYTC